MKIELPIELGQEVFIVPSEVNYKLNIVARMEKNNKVYKQHISDVTINSDGWYFMCNKDKEYGTGKVLLDKLFKETWFLSEDEALKKLDKLEKKARYLRV